MRRLLVAMVVLASVAAADPVVPRCGPGEPTTITDSVSTEARKTYRLYPFEVLEGVTRVEVSYSFADNTPLGQVPYQAGGVDLGLWDADGVGTPDGFRGWGGQNHAIEGRHDPTWVQADSAGRAFVPGPVKPGRWHVEAGIPTVAEGGLTYTFEIRCSAETVGAVHVPDTVARRVLGGPGWRMGDFHQHTWNSTETGPSNEEVVAHAREVGLEILPVLDYTTTRTFGQWGHTARDNPDLLFVPSREVITYYGHALAYGETPNVVEYRQGHDGISMQDIAEATVADGGLFGIAHPGYFPPPFENFCRGCAWQPIDELERSLVTSIELVAGPIEVDATYLGGPATPEGIENPFVQSNIDLMEAFLAEGYPITPTGGSDAKDAAGHGEVMTAVYLEEFSTEGLFEALREGRTYVRTKGADSPLLQFTASDGEATVLLGGTVADGATMTARVTQGAGQLLEITRNGLPWSAVPITSDDFTTSWEAVRGPNEGPLGTHYRVDIRDLQVRTVLSGPIFVADQSARPQAGSSDSAGDHMGPGSPGEPTSKGEESLPATGGGGAAAASGAALLSLFTVAGAHRLKK